MNGIKAELNKLLDEQKKALKSKALKFTDIGKEIYQIEAPKSVKVPSSWRQMSATKDLKRWYFRRSVRFKWKDVASTIPQGTLIQPQVKVQEFELRTGLSFEGSFGWSK